MVGKNDMPQLVACFLLCEELAKLLRVRVGHVRCGKHTQVSDSNFRGRNARPVIRFNRFFAKYLEFGIHLIFVHPLLRPTITCNA